MWNLFDRNPTAINHALATDSDNNLNKKILETLTAAEKKVIKNLRTKPKPFYAHLNRKKLTKAAITSIKSANSSDILRDPDKIAEEFAEFFATTFVKEHQGPLPDFSLSEIPACIAPLVLSLDDVGKILQKINASKAYGPDGVHPHILRSLSEFPPFIKAICNLFNKCLASGKIPRVWKEALVVPLHKKKEKYFAKNYRPVSLTCIIVKTYERFLHKHILGQFLKHASCNQHGFLPKRSCISNLLDCIDTVTKYTDQGH